MNLRIVLVFSSLLSLYSSLGIAQKPVPSGWHYNTGVAAISSPLYEGDDKNGFAIFPNIQVGYEDKFTASIGQGLNYRLWSSSLIQISAVGRFRFPRQEDDGGSPFLISGETDDLLGLGDVDGSFEIGSRASLEWLFLTSFIEIRRGLGGHGAVLGQASLGVKNNIGPLKIGLNYEWEWAEKAYAETYFGIDSNQSARSGLATYEAGGGLYRQGVQANLVLPIFYPWTYVLFASWKTLTSDIADSPLVKERGSDEQTVIGLVASYSF